MLAILASVSMTAVYLSEAVTIPARLFPTVFLSVLAVVFLPIAAFISTLLRAATVGRRTVTVGPFVPPR